jgi:predicted nucleic acid-binding protein
VAAYFFDSSALVKRYVNEIGTAWVINHFRPSANNLIYVARITHTEVISALSRRMRGGSLSASQTTKAIARFRRQFDFHFYTIEVTHDVVISASALSEKYFLRAYDAVQLAVALEINTVRLTVVSTALVLISADDALNTAAIAEGLTVDNPNCHP